LGEIAPEIPEGYPLKAHMSPGLTLEVAAEIF